MSLYLEQFGYGSFLLVITVLIFVHEWGHYKAARLCGVRVKVFSIGFGPELVSGEDGHGTTWRLGLIPLGGYVKMHGELLGGSEDSDPEAFHNKPLWMRASIVFAGPMANFVYAFVVLMVMAMTAGQPQPAKFHIAGIGGVLPDSPAEEAGLMAGDIITNVNAIPIESFDDLRAATAHYGAQPLEITYKREGELQRLTLSPRRIEDEILIGVRSPPPVIEVLGLRSALVSAASQIYNITRLTLVSLGAIFTGQAGLDDLGGPVRIADLSNSFAQQGWNALILFTVFLSVNLGLLNLLPIPVLDGGHLVFYAFEALRGKALADSVQAVMMKVGLILLLGLLIFVTLNDIYQLAL